MGEGIRADVEEVRRKAQAAYMAGDYAGSAELFQCVVQREPHYPDGWQGLGYALVAAKRHDEAVEAFRECLLLSGGRAEAHFGLAMALCGIKDEIGAARELEATLALKPDHAAAKKGLIVALVRAGKSQMALGRLSVAEELLSKAYKADHKNPDAILALIEYYRHVKLLNEASEIVRQAMQDVPHLPGIHDLAAEFGLQRQRERGWLY